MNLEVVETDLNCIFCIYLFQCGVKYGPGLIYCDLPSGSTTSFKTCCSKNGDEICCPKTPGMCPKDYHRCQSAIEPSLNINTIAVKVLVFCFK